jgi:hypothetical protein
MKIKFAFFAEAAQITSDSRLNLLGADVPILVFQGTPPWIRAILFLVVTVQLEPEDSGHLYHFMADLINPEGSRIDPHIESGYLVPKELNPDLVGGMRLIVQMNSLTFPGPGVYHMQVRIEDRERNISQEERIRLRVVEGGQANPPREDPLVAKP